MCCVIPPASPAMTLSLRMKSNKEVLPWSTCPMTVTIGDRETKFSTISSSLKTSCISSSTNSTSKPNSSATMVSVSLSKRWFMEAMMPKDIQVEMTSVAETPIMFATSSRVTNSVSLRVFSPSMRSSSAISRRSVRSARLSRRILEPFDFRPPPNFSSVSLILRSISSLETSLGAVVGAPRRAPKPGRVVSRRGPPTLAAPVVVRPPPAAGF